MTATDTTSKLAEALAAFQSELPPIGKANTANAGTYTYSYADLADISRAVMPLLGKHGLSFTSFPTLDEGGRFVLRYTLRHASGESDTGSYPLPANGSAQQMGSAISYARRYALSAVTGIAPDEDDDGKAAGTYEHRSERPAARPNGPQRPAQPPQDSAPAAGSEADRERAALLALCTEKKLDTAAVAARFRAQYEGAELGAESNANRVKAFRKLVEASPDAFRSAANGAQA